MDCWRAALSLCNFPSDRGNLQLFIGAADPRSTRVYWAYKSVAGPTGGYDKIFGYDPILDRFFQLSMTGEYLLGISQTGITLDGLDSISSSLDALTQPLDAYATAVQPEIGQFSLTHQQGFFRGPNLEAILETGEQGTSGNEIHTNGFRPIMDAPAGYGSVSWRQNQKDLPTVGTESPLMARTGYINFRRESRYIRFRLRIPAGTAWTFCAGIEPEPKIEGKD